MYDCIHKSKQTGIHTYIIMFEPHTRHYGYEYTHFYVCLPSVASVPAALCLETDPATATKPNGPFLASPSCIHMARLNSQANHS